MADIDDDMAAFLEWICPCKHAFVVRSGPGCDGYGKLFRHAVAGAVQPDGTTAVIKALVVQRVPWWLQWLIPEYPLRTADRRAIIGCIKAHGLRAVWERHKDGHDRFIESSRSGTLTP